MKDSINITIAKIDFAIYHLLHEDYSSRSGRFADHLNKLRARLIRNQKLTKKMKENLEWIERNVI
jgi:hypothetical protein